MRLRASEIAVATNGIVSGPDVEIDGATQDSREISGGELFVPVVAERDGHDFIPDALAAGAAAYLTARGSVGGTAIEVADTIVALSEAARAMRGRLHDAGVFGVTGSVGKTTVKDLLASVLGQERRTAASVRSFNNELGVPLTILNAPDDVEAVVIEMGARGRGHIAALAGIAQPSVGIVTRVASAHTELFGTVDDVAVAKRELVESLPEDGVAVLNAEDDRVAGMAAHTRARVVTFGSGGEVTAEGLAIDDELRPSFDLRSPWGAVTVRMTVRGAHQVTNALAAAAAALATGSSPDAVSAGLAAAVLSPARMSLVRLPSGAVVINDAYNANPASMRAALEALVALPAERRVAVLGVMAELGARSVAEHEAVGALARELGVRVIALGVREYGGDLVAGLDEAVAALGRLGPGDAVLVKASRVVGLDRLVDRLR
jgi:UDP-N-acetylmuramoyl-tripeptide--D-alanyl-D-alanine ligase